MVCNALLRLTGTLLVACYVGGGADQTGAIAGKTVDPSGLYLPSPKVRLNEQSEGGRRYDTAGDAQGQFRLTEVEPGVYTIKITVPGFRDKTIPDVRISPGQQSDLGVIGLDLAGCDAPGVICDDFGLSVYDDPIHSAGAIEIPQSCAVDIDEGNVKCTVELDGRGTIPPERDADSDFWIRTGADGKVYLTPRNSTSIALNPPTKRSKTGCITASYSTMEVRIDGLPIGSRVCIRTNRERYAQVAFFDVVKAKAEKVKVDYITWQGKTDGPTLQQPLH
jgi:hypothetical protein